MYLDPTFSRHLVTEAKAMIGTSFFDYIHPEEKERTGSDIRNIIESGTLFGSVTRCRYSRTHRIRSLLGAINPAEPKECLGLDQEERAYLATDIVVNWIGEGMALCFFHAIMDTSEKDNDEVNRTEWSNWCGMQPDSYTRQECQAVWQSIKKHRMLKSSKTGPKYVFQILSVPSQDEEMASPQSDPSTVLFSWPPPRLFSSPTDDTLAASSINFADGSYFVDDFARLAQGVNLLTLKKELSDANTSCTRRFRAKHTLTSEGMIRSVESVLIPYGSIVLACFSVTYTQLLSGPTTTILSADSLMAARGERQVEGTASSKGYVADAKDGTHSREPSKLPTSSNVTSASVPLIASMVNTSQGMPKSGGEVGNSAADDNSRSVATLAAVAAAAAAQSKSCASCGTSSSPEWRKGPDGTKSLCNACGLRFSRNISRARKREERALIAAEVAANGGIIPPHLRKKPGSDIKKPKKAKSSKTNTTKKDDDQRKKLKADEIDNVDATAAATNLVSLASEDVPSTTTTTTDDPSIQLARAAAQAAAAAGLHQL
jgi:hypothetical protein